MADPHIQSPMDIWDKISVIIYRSGFILATFAFALLPWEIEISQKLLIIAAAVAASSLHIYMKSIRYILQYVAYLGAIFALLNQSMLGVGMALITLSGLAYKEYFCFKVLGLNFQPFIAVLLWLSLANNWQIIANSLSLISAVLFALLSVKKITMPLHFDIGDKSKYE